jgi:HlyD family secretion protein
MGRRERDPGFLARLDFARLNFPRLTLATLLPAALLLTWAGGAAAQEAPPTRPDASLPKGWEATAAGRVEPRSQETRLGAPVVGRVVDVLVDVNDRVFAGEMLLRLDDGEALARLAAAEAQVELRRRVRDDERRRGSAERRRADDAAADAERSVAQAQATLDQAVVAARRARRLPAEDAAVRSARSALSQAQDELRQRRDELRAAREEAGRPSRAESELNAGRAEWTLAQAALEKTRLRAPFDGTVLRVGARIGEVTPTAAEPALMLLGDLSALRVRAELDERDVEKVRVGQGVVVRADAFKDRTFAGTVRAIAPFVGPGRISSRGQRNKLSDVDVVEVVVDLAEPGPLRVGMRVDVYFRSGEPER